MVCETSSIKSCPDMKEDADCEKDKELRIDELNCLHLILHFLWQLISFAILEHRKIIS